MENNNLQHAGIKGMKWGVRRYQNKDGSLTPEGRKRYDDYDDDYQAEQEAKRKERTKKFILAGIAAATVAVGIVGAAKYNQARNSDSVKNGENVLKEMLKKPSVKNKPKVQTWNAPLYKDKNRFKIGKEGDFFNPKLKKVPTSTNDNVMKIVNASRKLTKVNTTSPASISGMRAVNNPLWKKKWYQHDGLENGTTFDESTEGLTHAGIKGMRWGIRRFQNKDGSLTPAGRERYRDDISEEDDKKLRTEAKDRAVKSGNADRVKYYQSEMSNDELRKAVERVELNKRLRDIQSKEQQTGFDKAMSAVDKIDQIQKAGGTLVNVYNLVAKINNTFNKRFQIPGINDDAINFASAYGKRLDNSIKEARLAQEKGKAGQERAKARNERAKARQTEHNEHVQKEKYEESKKKKE